MRPAVLVLVALAGLVLLAPYFPGWYWSARTSNPVRRGAVLIRDLGCEHCHGPLGAGGIPEPSAAGGATTGGANEPEFVPAWSDGAWYEYVINEDQLRRIVLDGRLDLSSSEPEPGQMHMPAYGGELDAKQLDDVVAAFKVMGEMVLPPRGSEARSGYEVADRLECFACHGPGASGGLPNPGSWTGFVPGWYGPAFDGLVRDTAEFDDWIAQGQLERLVDHPIAGFFLSRQRIFMPAYPDLTEEERAALWSYTRWLAKTDGGHEAEIQLP